MPGKSYTNEINAMEVSMAIEQVLLAHYPQSWTPARIDVDAPPSGFYHMGAVVEDTPVFRASRESYQLETGIPMVRQFENVIKVDGTFEATLHTKNWRKIQFALGNETTVGSLTLIGTIGSLNITDGTFIATFTNVPTVGDQIVIALTEAGLQDPDAAETILVSVVDEGTSKFNPIPIATIADDYYIAYYGSDGSDGYVAQPIGGATIKYYSLLGVADFLDGTQVVHKFAKCAPAEEFSEEIRPDQTHRIGMTWNALGTKTTSYFGGQSELIVAERFYFPASH